jgi:hypothetical protein
MANQEIKRKIQILASRVQGRATTHSEDLRLDQVLGAKRITNRDSVREVLSESLNQSTAEVGTRLASHDDSDRLIDDIVQALKK